jgi:hypothetical protein
LDFALRGDENKKEDISMRKLLLRRATEEDPPLYPDSNSDPGDDTRMRPDRGSTPSTPPPTPRWVKVFGIIAIVVVLLVGIILITGIGGPHGLGRHMPSGDPGGDTPPIEQGVQQP